MSSMVQSAVTSETGPAILFGVLGVLLLVFALFLFAQSVFIVDTLRPLRVALGLLSLGFGAGLCYESAALATHAFPTISIVADLAFMRQQAWWVTGFGALMFGVGMLTLHFTRVAVIGSGMVGVQRFFDVRAHPLVWAAVAAAAIIVAALLVTSLDRTVFRRVGDPGFSWWVVYVGGALYAGGALVSWAIDWRP